ncbi:hypothetical protein Drorol1_Dr00018581 [Drosera rotundifolia]
MRKMKKELELISAIFYLLVVLASTVYASGPSKSHADDSLSPKAYLMQYCENEIPTSPLPKFLLARASPLTASQTALFAKMASRNALSSHIDSFCKSANLFCGKDAKLPSQTSPSTSQGTYHQGIYQNSYHQSTYSQTSQDCKFYKQKRGGVGDKNDDGVVREHDCIMPGTFFRENTLMSGTVIPMPDIGDRIPGRSFLPRSIESKLPFSSSNFQEVKHIFLTLNTSKVEAWMNATLRLCELTPNAGETKRCVRSGEDMIDFAASTLGRSIKIRTTKNTNGSGKDVMLGKVRVVDGGKAIDVVSCHQGFYPYLVYLCHALPNARVYEVDILDTETKAKINRGSAICHLDTSSWSLNHPAFSLLGSAPGDIEVCHWFYQNDFAWTIDA